MIRTALVRSLFVIAGLAIVGCSANVTVETQPNPAVPGQPVTITLTVENPQPCPLTGAEATLLVLAEESPFAVSGDALTSGRATPGSDLELFCDALNDPAETLCAELTDPDIPSELSGLCCDLPEFAAANPELCDPVATTPSEDSIREAIIEKARELGLPVDKILGAGSGVAATSGSTVECMVLTEEDDGAFFECILGDIPANGSVTATATFTPGIAGRYFSLALVQGDSDCATNDGGTGCGPFLVGASAMAPATSPAGLAALIFGLIGIGGWAIRARRRSA